jgi:hypothetical protein
MSERTARINCLRGLLRELGFFIPTGAREVIPAVWSLVEDADASHCRGWRYVCSPICSAPNNPTAFDSYLTGGVQIPLLGSPRLHTPIGVSRSYRATS